MIKVKKTGTYMLVETWHNTKILYLDNAAYAWVSIKRIGEVLIATHTAHHINYILSRGGYALYEVEGEPSLTDLQHLELEYGNRAWQGYLLTTGLPTSDHKRARIIPTSQIITGSPFHSVNLDVQAWRNMLDHQPVARFVRS